MIMKIARHGILGVGVGLRCDSARYQQSMCLRAVGPAVGQLSARCPEGEANVWGDVKVGIEDVRE